MHSQIEEKYSQEIENSHPISLQKGNSSNLHEGEGETREIEKPRSPLEIVQTLSSPDKGSVVKIFQNTAEEPKSHQIIVRQGTLSIPEQVSVVKVTPTPSS